MRKQNEKKKTIKDEGYYVQKTEALRKMKLNGKALIIGEYDSDRGNIEYWLTDLEGEEVHKPTHGACFVAKGSNEAKGGKCFMVQGISSGSQVNFLQKDGFSDVCWSKVSEMTYSCKRTSD